MYGNERDIRPSYVIQSMNPYEVLGLKRGASLEEIRQRYKHLAKLNHPDRLHNVDESEKKEKEEYFKKVTVAYHLAVECATDQAYCRASDTSDASDGNESWGEVLMNTLVDVATKYIQRREHRLQVPVEMSEVYFKKTKKLQIFLTGVKEPVMLTIRCDKKRMNTDIIAEDGSVHKVLLDIVMRDHPTFFFAEADLVANVDVTWAEYLTGKTIQIPFLDGSMILVKVPPFANIGEWFEHPSGLFRVNVQIRCPTREWWEQIDECAQETIIKLLENIRT